MPPYSLDLRTRVAAACQQPGARQAAVAARFDVRFSFVQKLLHQQRQTGSLTPKPASGGRARYLEAAAQAWLVTYVGQHPAATLAELGQAWLAQGGQPVGQTGRWQMLAEHELRRKKSRHASERDTPRVVAQRQEFVETVAQGYNPRRFHFLDETGLRLDACRRYGRAVDGQRVGQAVPVNRGTSLTLLGALGPQGLVRVQLFKGALTQERFALYVSGFLAPVLRPGDVLVLDNLSAHKVGGLREWLAERGVDLLFLPPYSPDFSPLSRPGASSKRPCAPPRPAVGTPCLQDALRTAVDWISRADAQHWFDHCGYHIQPAS